jgi:hypothetical protein
VLRRPYCEFDSQGYLIDIAIVDRRACEINYSHGGGPFTDDLVKAFLSTTAPGAVWIPQRPQTVGRETWTTGEEGTSSCIWASIFKKQNLLFKNQASISASVPTPTATPLPTPTPTPDPALLAGPRPDVGVIWGVSLTVHDWIKKELNDPDSYKFVETYEPQLSEFGGKPCWLELLKFRSKNGFGGIVTGTAGVFLVVGPGGHETVLSVIVQ